MKKLIFACLTAVSLCAVAADEGLSESEKEAKKAAAKQRMMEKTGGLIEKAGTGKLVVVNCQQKYATADVAAKADQLNKVLRVGMETKDGSWKFGDKVPEGANAAIYVVDDPTLPMTLIATEACWGVLNVSQLDTPARFNKAFARTAIMTFGGGVSQFKGSPMQTVTKPEDLDKIVSEGVTFDAMQSIMRNLQAIGVTQAKKTTYRKAVMEGWADQPTNDYQKVIWEEVHAKPTNPMKIKFDPAKGE